MAGTRKSVLATVKENPVISTLAAFALVMTTITGTLTATGQLDSLIMTEAEHNADFVPLAAQVEENKRWNQCHRLELNIQRIEDRIWEREQSDDPDEEVLRDLRERLRQLEREFDAKDCVEVLDA